MKGIGKPFQRPGKKGWWLRWTECGKRIMKNFHTEAMAYDFWHELYGARNAGLLKGMQTITLMAAIERYLLRYETRGLTNSAKVEAEISCRRLLDLLGDIPTKQIRQDHLDALARNLLAENDDGKTLSRWTVNKHIANLRAFVRWCSARERRYMADGLVLEKVKAERKPVHALTVQEVGALLRACSSRDWYVRILLSLCSGLRSGDVDCLRPADFDISAAAINSRSRKTAKTFQGRPVPSALVPILQTYLVTVAGDLVFDRVNARKDWESIRERAGLPACTRHDLRKTFSTLIQLSDGMRAAQRLLEHSSATLTANHYTDEMAVLRNRVEQLPVKEWIAAAGDSPNIQIRTA